MASIPPEPTWGSKKMDEFIAWITQPSTRSKVAHGGQAVDPALARKHIDNIIKYVDWVEKFAQKGDRDAIDMIAVLGPIRSALSAARTGAEIAAAAEASKGYFDAFMIGLTRRAGDKAVLKAGFTLGDKSVEADNERTVAEVSVERKRPALSLRVIAFNNPDGTSIPQLFACKVERDFIHRLMFWKKTHDLPYAPCDSIQYLRRLVAK